METRSQLNSGVRWTHATDLGLTMVTLPPTDDVKPRRGLGTWSGSRVAIVALAWIVGLPLITVAVGFIRVLHELRTGDPPLEFSELADLTVTVSPHGGSALEAVVWLGLVLLGPPAVLVVGWAAVRRHLDRST